MADPEQEPGDRMVWIASRTDGELLAIVARGDTAALEELLTRRILRRRLAGLPTINEHFRGSS